MLLNLSRSTPNSSCRWRNSALAVRSPCARRSAATFSWTAAVDGVGADQPCDGEHDEPDDREPGERRRQRSALGGEQLVGREADRQFQGPLPVREDGREVVLARHPGPGTVAEPSSVASIARTSAAILLALPDDAGKQGLACDHGTVAVDEHLDGRRRGCREPRSQPGGLERDVLDRDQSAVRRRREGRRQRSRSSAGDRCGSRDDESHSRGSGPFEDVVPGDAQRGRCRRAGCTHRPRCVRPPARPRTRRAGRADGPGTLDKVHLRSGWRAMMPKVSSVARPGRRGPAATGRCRPEPPDGGRARSCSARCSARRRRGQDERQRHHGEAARWRAGAPATRRR